MATEVKKRGLGRGLDALFKDARRAERAESNKAEDVSRARSETRVQKDPPVRAETREPKIMRAGEMAAAIETKSVTGAPKTLPIDRLQPGKFQPRRHFDDVAISSLAESISVHGVLQPLLVRPLKDGVSYEIIAGERRWRAAQKAQLHDVPVVIQALSDNDALEIALIENLQREDLSPIEEAEGYQRLIDEFRHTQDVLAHRLGKSRSHVTNMLRLLKLPNSVQKHLQAGSISMGHARALVGVENAAALAEIIVKKGLSVRQTENLVKGADEKKAQAAARRKPKSYVPRDVDVLALEERITAALGLKVQIDETNSSGGAEGVLRIEYKSLDQLDDLIERLTRLPVTKF